MSLRGGPDRRRGGYDRGRGDNFGGRGGRGAPGFNRGLARGGFSGPNIYKENVPAQIPDCLTPENQDKLIGALRKVPPKPERPTRPGFGTLGKPVVLRANFFVVKLPEGPLFEYEIKIEPATRLKERKDRIFWLLERRPEVRPQLGSIAHDRGTRLVSANKLPNLRVEIPFYEEGQNGPPPNTITYTVSVVFKGDLNFSELSKYLNADKEHRDYDPLPIISALNLVMQQNALHTGVRIGQNKYYFQPPPGQRKVLGPGIEAWRGYFLSVRPAYQQLMVNINVCMAPFVEPGNLADVLESFNRNSSGGMPTLPKALARSIKVVTTHLGYKRHYKLWEIGLKSARDTTFPCEEFGKKDMSVKDFFKKKYDISLHHATDLPVVNVGSVKRPIWLPAEICRIEAGNPYRGRLGDQEVAQMIRYACNPPRVNAEFIVDEGFKKLSLSPPQPPVNMFGLSIDQEMAVIPGRELPPPTLSYRQGSPRVTNGSWNILDTTFHRGATVNGFWVLPIRERMHDKYPSPQDIKPLIMAFSKKLQSAGMNGPAGMLRLLRELPPLAPVREDPGRVNSLNLIRSCLRHAMQTGPRPSFVLVLLMYRDNFIYPGVKRIGDCELGLQTITMQLDKAMRKKKQDQYLSNIALKVNTKLGGINHKLDDQAMRWLRKKKTMMVGIDVTHPAPETRFGTPSIAAIVASVDDDFVQFPASMRIQRPDTNKHSKEVVEELQHMMHERLLVYKKKNKALPERILVFRDGVSEGQYDIVIREEVVQIKEAAKRLNTKDGKAYKPLVSVIICGKRHHSRFYPTGGANADKNGNTKPGTVVDKGITGVFDYDFYLQAHAGLQGTVKPTHYVVIYDENSLDVDELQKGTNNTSYLYARATKAVSLIPAAYYADLACERGRCYLNEILSGDNSTVSGSLSRDEEAAKVFQAAEKAWGKGLHDDIKESMFYI
ncbi:argonaute-like protein [Guyanagaster necrorhizus]|uniref:Argonaute-like protein n=1 Tax=Guyanagaster necrorhizus TaxID=856835 RepID=A0A9P7VH35_9AGAR|nr:argonaute-like protein [Guyanagaster necrorhizus MCA 3950]KAG7440908.1 argonaute-like protein [Guyanagaster necrorhizus MCA 3950]